MDGILDKPDSIGTASAGIIDSDKHRRCDSILGNCRRYTGILWEDKGEGIQTSNRTDREPRTIRARLLEQYIEEK